ncbi:MAG: 16S rRNA (cytosine(967)-C(5))-methyltransferase RsmB [Eubacteriaceae bacterium]|nr:16S rRNA (cytosine(967)-C(5))-methyltransferase RsmB [Eubacteriaceae bacterium]
MNIREQAVNTLLKINREGAYSNLEVRQVLSRNLFSEEDKRLFLNLVYGTWQNQIFLDDRLNRLIKNAQKPEPIVREICRISLYQILFLDRVPDYAIVNEAVTLCKRQCRRASGFVNGVLRSALRQKAALQQVDTADFDNEKEAMAVRYSIPVPIIYQYFTVFGKEKAPEILKKMNETPPFFIRINTLKTDRESLAVALKQQGVPTRKGSLSQDALQLVSVNAFHGQIQRSSLYRQGAFTIQDQGAMLIADWLDPQPGEQVLDMCAAPGGKTTHLAQLMKNQGRIIARDIYDSRLKLIEQTADRMGVTIIETEKRDGTEAIPDEHNRYDKILLDVPCSGTGIIRRKPELRVMRDKKERRKLRDSQRQMLHCGLKALKSGGTLVYSTCTVDPDENERLVATVCQNYPEVSSVRSQYTHPLMDGCDCFFMCQIKKKD